MIPLPALVLGVVVVAGVALGSSSAPPRRARHKPTRARHVTIAVRPFQGKWVVVHDDSGLVWSPNETRSRLSDLGLVRGNRVTVRYPVGITDGITETDTGFEGTPVALAVFRTIRGAREATMGDPMAAGDRVTTEEHQAP